MELTLTNKNGETLDLLNNDSRLVLCKAENMHGIDTDIATTEAPYMDGVSIDSVKALPRSIALTFKVKSSVSENIAFFTNIVKSKQFVTLTEKENGREITIKGVATIPPFTRMLSACEIKLTIYCGQPYWEDMQKVVGAISLFLDRLYFPSAGQYFTPAGRAFGVIDTNLEKTYNNTGDTAVGMNIKIVALGKLKNPRISCSTGEQNGFYMQLDVTLEQGDEIEINTTRGSKYVKLNGAETYNGKPLLSYLTFYGTDWLQLETGKNTFNVTASEGEENAYFVISYKRRYE